MKKKSNPIKECLQYNISVEGENCELLYFEHLKKLINECEKAKYKVNFFIRAKTPSSFAKSRISIYTQKGNKKRTFGWYGAKSKHRKGVFVSVRRFTFGRAFQRT